MDGLLNISQRAVLSGKIRDKLESPIKHLFYALKENDLKDMRTIIRQMDIALKHLDEVIWFLLEDRDIGECDE